LHILYIQSPYIARVNGMCCAVEKVLYMLILNDRMRRCKGTAPQIVRMDANGNARSPPSAASTVSRESQQPTRRIAPDRKRRAHNDRKEAYKSGGFSGVSCPARDVRRISVASHDPHTDSNAQGQGQGSAQRGSGRGDDER